MGRPVTNQQPNRRGVRRTLWITGTIAVALFLLSILSMLRIG
ncbi:hypothetical protein [Fulvimonas yonginensis]|uniref:Uncharacterized protein n=1 Tax=Fulvimonas yonginensis TaxID=1495200 RepID=A0ABU8JC40_9GAMM